MKKDMDCQTFVKFHLIRMFDEDFESQTWYKYVPLRATKSFENQGFQKPYWSSGVTNS